MKGKRSYNSKSSKHPQYSKSLLETGCVSFFLKKCLEYSEYLGDLEL
jgi:hypothetical protein